MLAAFSTPMISTSEVLDLLPPSVDHPQPVDDTFARVMGRPATSFVLVRRISDALMFSTTVWVPGRSASSTARRGRACALSARACARRSGGTHTTSPSKASRHTKPGAQVSGP